MQLAMLDPVDPVRDLVLDPVLDPVNKCAGRIRQTQSPQHLQTTAEPQQRLALWEPLWRRLELQMHQCCRPP